MCTCGATGVADGGQGVLGGQLKRERERERVREQMSVTIRLNNKSTDMQFLRERAWRRWGTYYKFSLVFFTKGLCGVHTNHQLSLSHTV